MPCANVLLTTLSANTIAVNRESDVDPSQRFQWHAASGLLQFTGGVQSSPVLRPPRYDVVAEPQVASSCIEKRMTTMSSYPTVSFTSWWCRPLAFQLLDVLSLYHPLMYRGLSCLVNDCSLFLVSHTVSFLSCCIFVSLFSHFRAWSKPRTHKEPTRVAWRLRETSLSDSFSLLR